MIAAVEQNEAVVLVPQSGSTPKPRVSGAAAPPWVNENQMSFTPKALHKQKGVED
jgi:hypothetical protein